MKTAKRQILKNKKCKVLWNDCQNFTISFAQFVFKNCRAVLYLKGKEYIIDSWQIKDDLPEKVIFESQLPARSCLLVELKNN